MVKPRKKEKKKKGKSSTLQEARIAREDPSSESATEVAADHTFHLNDLADQLPLADTAETALTEVTSTEVAPAYPSEITEAASEYGFKAANLEFLDKMVNGNPEFEGISVPQFWGIKNTDVLGHLDAHASGWRGLWDEFRAIQGKSESGVIGVKLRQN